MNLVFLTEQLNYQIMNKYICPIFDHDAYQIWNEVINASSFNSAKEKLINKILTDFEIEEDYDNWEEFVERMDEFQLVIGKLIDIESL